MRPYQMREGRFSASTVHSITGVSSFIYICAPAPHRPVQVSRLTLAIAYWADCSSDAS